MGKTIDVVIPTYRPGTEFRELLLALLRQSVHPEQILIINTEESLFDPALLDGIQGPVRVVHIRKQEFDHGGTRHLAATMLSGDLLLFLTQDAVPKDEHLIETLAEAFEDSRVGAAYARQLPREDCSVLERYTREFNYPAESCVKTKEDLPKLGIKTFFCSNVCAMYRRSAYEKAGGFERHTIFNEDMILAGKMIYAGEAVAYCAEAEVVHSHNYTGAEQFHRNFDIGVSQREHPEIFSGVSSQSEGMSLVRKIASDLFRNGRLLLIIQLFYISACKYLGYLLGGQYQHLPKAVVRACSLNKEYWDRDS